MSKLKAIQDKVANKRSGAHAELLNPTENEQIHKYENELLNKTVIKKRATFEFDEDFHTELKIFATQNKTKMVDVVVTALRKYMDEQKK
ncbi:hypothetical protein [Robertmurraya sp.]|uniref:hypothetical protein n=1 Tax=Robertmurraya sp. TaxID=2837525 RepID=UPI0037044765